MNLPASTSVHKQLAKKTIYAKFELKQAQRDSFDADVSRLDIVNLISPRTVPAIPAGNEVKEIFVIEVALKKKAFDEKNIALVAKLIPQRILFVLRYEDRFKLAIYHNKLFCNEWSDDESGIDLLSDSYSLDTVWEHIVRIVGNIGNDSNAVERQNLSLDEQIAADEQRQKLEKRIKALEKQLSATKQPHQKRELFEMIKKLKGENKT